MTRATIIKGYCFAIFSAVIYGCMPLMSKYIYADGVTPLTLVLLRNLLAVPVLGIIAFCQNKTLRIPLKAIPHISLIAFMGCCLTPMLLFSSYQFIDSGTATVLHFVYPAAVVVGGFLFLRKRISMGTLLSVILCVAGILLFFSPEKALDPVGATGAILSGFAFAAYVLLLPGFPRQSANGFLFNFYVAVTSSVIMIIACLVSGQLVLPVSAQGWGLCIFFALVVTVCAVAMFQKSILLIGGEKTSVLSTLEAITSVFVGVFVFHEVLGVRGIIGAILVLTASFLIAILDLKKTK